MQRSLAIALLFCLGALVLYLASRVHLLSVEVNWIRTHLAEKSAENSSVRDESLGAKGADKNLHSMQSPYDTDDDQSRTSPKRRVPEREKHPDYSANSDGDSSSSEDDGSEAARNEVADEGDEIALLELAHLSTAAVGRLQPVASVLKSSEHKARIEEVTERIDDADAESIVELDESPPP